MTYLERNLGRGGTTHDRIQRDLERHLREHVRRDLDGDDIDHIDAVDSERTLRGTLPSGKEYCRADVVLDIPEHNRRRAFEIKVSVSDAKNWPTQKQDYNAAGFDPAVVVPVEVIYDAAPGHRLITDDDHIIAHNGEFHLQLEDAHPELERRFEITRPYDLPPDYCPSCGYTLASYHSTRDGTLQCRCDVCGWMN